MSFRKIPLKKQVVSHQSEIDWFQTPVKLAWSPNLDNEVIVKKCVEIKSINRKLTRHQSLEKDSSILNNCKPNNFASNNIKTVVATKPNLEIFLAQNQKEPVIVKPKYLQPLVANASDTNKQFRIKKPKPTEVAAIEKEEESSTPSINVIVRPMTAQLKREKIENKRFRPPLIRSSSAPSLKPKFPASKRKLKKNLNRKETEEEWKNAPTSEIVTMVSLISPNESENEDESKEEKKMKDCINIITDDKKEESNCNVVATTNKSLSLRKTMKSVSFQQSSIHSIRSFSASFPGRRTSILSALGTNNNICTKTQEKRSSNPASPDGNKRVPKRRLLNEKEESKNKSNAWQKASRQLIIRANNKPDLRLDLEDNVLLVHIPENKEDTEENNNKSDETQKDQECRAMYRKMTEKGINVSFDTILRGLLTPTEYRIRRQITLAEEMSVTMNPVIESK